MCVFCPLSSSVSGSARDQGEQQQQQQKTLCTFCCSVTSRRHISQVLSPLPFLPPARFPLADSSPTRQEKTRKTRLPLLERGNCICGVTHRAHRVGCLVCVLLTFRLFACPPPSLSPHVCLVRSDVPSHASILSTSFLLPRSCPPSRLSPPLASVAHSSVPAYEKRKRKKRQHNTRTTALAPDQKEKKGWSCRLSYTALSSKEKQKEKVEVRECESARLLLLALSSLAVPLCLSSSVLTPPCARTCAYRWFRLSLCLCVFADYLVVPLFCFPFCV